jgi:hypothetical protein
MAFSVHALDRRLSRDGDARRREYRALFRSVLDENLSLRCEQRQMVVGSAANALSDRSPGRSAGAFRPCRRGCRKRSAAMAGN